MIPKRIFYVWGYGELKSQVANICIENWRMMLPEYEIIEVNEKTTEWFNFDYEYKEKQRPIIEANKEFERKKRKFLQEVKMSREEPTKKQLYYYDRLCKKYSIEKKDVKELSKLDLRNEIERILDEHSNDYKNVD